MTRDNGRMACGIAVTLGLVFAAAPALAQEMTSKIDGGDTAWMISATALVLMMTIPGLALFYCGMVRKTNVLATMAQSLACATLCSLLWFAVGYSLSFVGDGPWLGTFERAFLRERRQHVLAADVEVVVEVRGEEPIVEALEARLALPLGALGRGQCRHAGGRERRGDLRRCEPRARLLGAHLLPAVSRLLRDASTRLHVRNQRERPPVNAHALAVVLPDLP